MKEGLLVIFSLLLLHDISAKRECFANGDCFELKDFQPDCPGVGQQGTGTIKVRLDHSGGVYVFYNLDVLVDWDEAVENYTREPSIPINEDYTFEVPYTYSSTGTYSTQARVNVILTLDEPPNDEQFASKKMEIIVGNGFCEAGATDQPTTSPTLSMVPTGSPTVTALPTITSSAPSTPGTSIGLAVGQLLLLLTAFV